MKTNLRIDTPLDTSTPLWRYFKVQWFEAMILNKGIYLSRQDRLGDPFEGSLPDDYTKLKKDGWGVGPWGVAPYGSPDPYYLLKKFSEFERNLMYICCFCNKDHESTLMWKGYCDVNQGIAIKTTVGKLWRSIEDSIPNDLYLNKVRYVDFEKEQFNKNLDLISVFSLKKIEFADECEVRLIIKNEPRVSTLSDRGGYIKINPLEFIEEIVLFPEIGKDQKDQTMLLNVKKFLEKNGLAIPIRYSKLTKEPNF